MKKNLLKAKEIDFSCGGKTLLFLSTILPFLIYERIFEFK